MTESLSFEKSEGNMTSIVQRKDISEPLSCGGMLWTNVVNAYGCLGSHTDTLSKWSDREILTTYNKHYFFTHSPAFSLAGYLLPNKSDLDILKRCDDSLVHFFHLSRAIQVTNRRNAYLHLVDQLLNWDLKHKRTEQDKLYVAVPFIYPEEERREIKMVRRELTEDITIYHLPLSVPQEIISKTAVIDSDFNDPKIQRQMAQYIMSIRFDYNEKNG